MHRLEYLWVATHAKVVVGAPYGNLLVGRFFVGAREVLRQAIDVVEVPVRFILVFFVELIVVKSFVVERSCLCGRRSCSIGRLAGGGLEGCVGERNGAYAALACRRHTQFF